MKMTWKKVWFGAYQCGPYIIEKTSNPDAARSWYVRGGSAEFDEALRHAGGFNGGFFSLAKAKTAVAKAHEVVRAELGS